MAHRLQNFIDGAWRTADSSDVRAVHNPATWEVLAEVPLCGAEEVESAVSAAATAYPAWRRTPVTERVQYLFKLKTLLETHLPELARTITLECGKTLAEARAELRRAIDNVEVACGMPSLMQGYNNEDVAAGIDEHLFRQPLGIVTAITPFNFPAMIPMWYLPYALACGNCFILKPSEQVPQTSVRLFELLQQTGLPQGVAQLVHGGRQLVEALADHPRIEALSFVGSTPVARQVYARATAAGKRAQCQGGAKNPAIILPDADPALTTRIITESAFGCAGQRCLAISMGVLVGEARNRFAGLLAEEAGKLTVGYGLDSNVQMGPVINRDSRERIAGLIERGVSAGSRVLLEGRDRTVPGCEDGAFLHPTVLGDVEPTSEVARTEAFGPVLSLVSVRDIDEALALVNRPGYGNMACLFTTSGQAARKFRHEAVAGNIGINVGVAAPMAFFPFSGWKESFFGDLHAQGRHAVEFYTQTKVVVERW